MKVQVLELTDPPSIPFWFPVYDPFVLALAGHALTLSLCSLAALDNASIRCTSPVRQLDWSGFLQVHHVGAHREHRPSLRHFLSHALSGQSV